MNNGKYYIAAIVGLLLIVTSVAAWAQTSETPQQVVKTEVKVVNQNGVVTVSSSGDQQPHVSTLTFVATEMGFESSKVVKGVPFSADTVTEFTQILGNGQRIYRSRTASLYRDSEGRTRREQTIDVVGPYAASAPVHKTIMINDPVAGSSYVLDTDNHSAVKTATHVFSGEAGGTVATFVFKPGDATESHISTNKVVIDGVKAAGGVGVMGGTLAKVAEPTISRTEPLGTQVIEGFAAEGTRTIETIPAGTIGNDTPIEIVSEKWYSEELGMVVKTVRNDPLSGMNVYQLKNIRRGEPSPELFQIPADYTIKETAIKFQTIKK
jgi:hypothetical protein